MVITKFFAGIMLLGISFFMPHGCDKKEAVKQMKSNPCPDPVYPLEGLWIGYYTVDNEPRHGKQFFSITIKQGGEAVVETEWDRVQHLSPGKWTLEGNDFSCTFTCVYGLPQHIGIVETFDGTWTNDGKLSGTWINEPPRSGSGKVSLQRVN